MVNADKNKPVMSSDFAWDLARQERNQDFLERFDVQKAKQIIVARPRPVEFLDWKMIRPAIQEFLEGVKLKENIDWTAIDLSLPVIFARTKCGKVPIDGRHRLAKAIQEGPDSLPVIFLTEAETDSIRITLNIT